MASSNTTVSLSECRLCFVLFCFTDSLLLVVVTIAVCSLAVPVLGCAISLFESGTDFLTNSTVILC